MYCLELRKQWNISLNGAFEGNHLSINFIINQTSKMIDYLHMAFEYFLPPFITVTSEGTLMNFVKPDADRLMYMFSGNFTLSNSFVHKITGAFNNANCRLPGIFLSHIPIKLTFQSKTGKPWELFERFQTTIQCAIVQKLNIHKEKEASQGSYGRGIYWDGENACIYLCMNQHVESSKSACYFSNDAGSIWKDLDISIGSVLGHHSVTKDLYAIHRNQKTYMMFHTVQRKWVALTNQQFKGRASSYLDPNSRRSLEGNNDQVYSLGPYQWKGNPEGLFYRKVENDSWIARAKWHIFKKF